MKNNFLKKDGGKFYLIREEGGGTPVSQLLPLFTGLFFTYVLFLILKVAYPLTPKAFFALLGNLLPDPEDNDDFFF